MGLVLSSLEDERQTDVCLDQTRLIILETNHCPLEETIENRSI